MNPALITGLVLAGGQGRRMGGVDKGLQAFAGATLAQHALLRLAPQVGRTMLSANRHLDDYRKLGVPVWPDARPAALPEYAGPLAGVLAGLLHCETPLLATVPCDTPHFPLDLVLRLSDAMTAADAEIAMAVSRDGDSLQPEPTFCLIRVGLANSLRAFMQSGQRRVRTWAAQHRLAEAVFDEPGAFANANTLDDLDRLRAPRGP
ncbi:MULTISPECIES: molybdenum cofactor guanylyltransferase MobA [unclassified Rhizobacter]|uniref:molybdenum cofactor guanylyltransferase MobA n=1 Tax=unclassified Rhizobacter TaxID=2640088 RepID=UPI0006FA1270|nr:MULTISPECIES: molybdenum cofactor guanylyltransferase MobA [unclassified Rhizobacter]KQU81004.1 molybdenum cofactor guanylyltransferase [Rhizobacter sp. Root29]KQW04548.1 molybdenum cofactor guanylyltransferase [Rhizobacter sp. Root1238]KRB06390.1 molybdenum cofactor guanylyltransferase [Rhizobacter sp. Root16D2]